MTASEHATTRVRSLAATLRAETRELHARTERTGIMSALLRRQLDRAGYCALLRNLHSIYDALEEMLVAHRRHPAIDRIFDRALFRGAALAADLEFLHGPGWDQSIPVAAAARAYVRRLHACAQTPAWLLAHAYVRYLGDLHGGQILRHVVAESLGLDAGPGASFYQFAVDDPQQRAQQFRVALDEIELGDATAAHVVGEARWAFAQHIALFEQLSSGGRP
jgi:heme oxygenase